MGNITNILLSINEEEKEAAKLPNFILAGAATAAGITGVNLLTHGVAGLYDAMTKAKLKGGGFEKMLNANPDLSSEDVNKVKAYYDMLVDFSPTIAKNPIIAGNWVKSRVRMEGLVQAQDIKALVDTQAVINKENKTKAFLNNINQSVSSSFPNMPGLYVKSD